MNETYDPSNMNFNILIPGHSNHPIIQCLGGAVVISLVNRFRSQ